MVNGKDSLKEIKSSAKFYEKICESFPGTMTRADKYFKPHQSKIEKFVAGWCSRHFIATLFQYVDGTKRLNIHRAKIDPDTYRWVGDITWDELMEVKRQCGYGNEFAIEIFPEDENIIDTDNVRHLWIIGSDLLGEMNFFWSSKSEKISGLEYVLEKGDVKELILQDPAWNKSS